MTLELASKLKNTETTRSTAVSDRQSIVPTYLQFWTKVSFWCLFVL